MGVDEAVEVDVGVRDGVVVAVAVAGARSANAKLPNAAMYPQSVPCSGSMLSKIWPGKAVQLEPSLWSRTRRCGSVYGDVSKMTQSFLFPGSSTVLADREEPSVVSQIVTRQ